MAIVLIVEDEAVLLVLAESVIRSTRLLRPPLPQRDPEK